MITEGVLSVEEPGRVGAAVSGAPADGDPSLAPAGVEPARAPEPDASAEVAETAEPESQRDESRVLACGHDESLARIEGDQALEGDGGAEVVAEELCTTRRTEDPEIGPGDALGEHGIAPEAPNLVWIAEAEVVPTEGVG